MFTGSHKVSANGDAVPGGFSTDTTTLAQLASAFFGSQSLSCSGDSDSRGDLPAATEIYRHIVEQIPAIVFVAFFDRRFGEAYIAPQIEAILGYTPAELLEDPARLPDHVHPNDRDRLAREVEHLFSTGQPLHSTFRLLSKDGRTVRFQCDVKIVRDPDSLPWFIHGTAFDITQQLNDEAIRDYADRMQFLSRRLIEVQESERRSIALELHDEIGQTLTGLKLKLEMLARAPADATKTSFEDAQQIVNELISRTRALSLDLRPATLDHLGLLSALLRHLRNYTSRTGVTVAFDHDGLEGRRFNPELETAAFRIVQEALTNVARHSGSSEAQVDISLDRGRLTITITDQGKGFDPETAFTSGITSGLTGMRERASLLGGSLDVESGVEGTCLTAVWNLPDI